MQKIFPLLLLLLVHKGESQKLSSTKTDFGNVNNITTQQLHEYLSFIASDILQGRDTPSRGQELAAKFIATHLAQWGFKGAGDSGTFFQNIALLRSKIIPPKTTITINRREFFYGKDFISTPVATNISAPLVFVKNGYMIKGKNINPYEGIDVKGKIVVIEGGLPKGITMGDLAGKRGVDYDIPPNYAMNHGAAAVIAIPSARALENWTDGERNYAEKGEISVLKFRNTENQPVAAITASEEFINALFEKEKTGVQTMWKRSSADSVSSFEFSPETKVTLSISTYSDTATAKNIVAVLEGADKKLRKEYVAFGAHYDHIGTSSPVNGDSINNGADDDGSGTVGLLACAEAFAKGTRPKRSLLFVWHTAEEKGLKGSKYFTQFPTVPLSNIVTQINIDMIGRSLPDRQAGKPDSGAGSDNVEMSGRNEVFVIGSNMMSSELGKLSEDVNNSFLHLKLNYLFDNPLHPLKLFYRSDHYNYAKNNIPIIFYFDGIHEDYHQPSDEIEKIDFEKLASVTKTVFALGWKLANLPKRPVIDKEFPKEVFE